jgi:hypothetical protein
MKTCSEATALLPVGAVFGTFIAEGPKSNQPATRADMPEWCSGRNRSDFTYWQIFRVLSQFALYIMGVSNPVVSPRTLLICKKPANYRPTLPNFSKVVCVILPVLQKTSQHEMYGGMEVQFHILTSALNGNKTTYGTNRISRSTISFHLAGSRRHCALGTSRWGSWKTFLDPMQK